jgi:hypothetical protein
MDKDTLKKRIKDRFIAKQKGFILIKVNNSTKLKIQYMYGAKYSLCRVTKKKEEVLSLLLDLNDLVNLILKEKVRNKIGKLLK